MVEEVRRKREIGSEGDRKMSRVLGGQNSIQIAFRTLKFRRVRFCVEVAVLFGNDSMNVNPNQMKVWVKEEEVVVMCGCQRDSEQRYRPKFLTCRVPKGRWRFNFLIPFRRDFTR